MAFEVATYFLPTVSGDHFSIFRCCMLFKKKQNNSKAQTRKLSELGANVTQSSKQNITNENMSNERGVAYVPLNKKQ